MARKKLRIKVKEGALHKQMGIAPDKKIPESRLEEAKHSKNPKLRKRAQFAINAKKWKHGKMPRPGQD